MRIVTVIWLSCLVAVAVVLPAKAQTEIGSQPKQDSMELLIRRLFNDRPVVIPQVTTNDGVSRYFDNQNRLDSEALSVHKYELGILDNPGAQNKIMIDNVFRDFRLNMQKR